MTLPDQSTFVADPGGTITVTPELVGAPAFATMLRVLESPGGLAIANAKIEPDAEGGFAVLGAGRLFGRELRELELYFADENGQLQFQLSGTLASITIGELAQREILTLDPLDDLSFVRETPFSDALLVFDSERETLYVGVEDSQHRLDHFQALGLPLGQVGFEFSRDYASRAMLLMLRAALRFGQTTIDVRLDLPCDEPLDASTWTLRLGTPINLAQGFQDLVGFLDTAHPLPIAGQTSWRAALPSPLAEIPSFALSDLQMQIDPAARAVRFFSLTLSSAHPITFPNTSFQIERIGAEISAMLWPDQTTVLLSLFGYVAIDEYSELDLRVSIPISDPLESAWTARLHAQVTLEQLRHIDQLASHTGVHTGELHLPEGFFSVDMKSFELNQLEVVFEPAKGIEQITLSISTELTCHLGSWLAIGNPALDIQVVNPFASASIGTPRDITGAIRGFVEIGPLFFTLEARKQAQGWSFRGELGQPVAIGAALDAIGQHFGVGLPQLLRDFTLEELLLRFETGAGGASSVDFALACSLQVHGEPAACNLAIHIAQGPAGAVRTITGSLTVADITLGVAFGTRDHDLHLVASYAHTPGSRRLRLGDAGRAVGLAEPTLLAALDKAEIDLKDAVFAYSKHSGAPKYLLGLDLGLDLSLSNLPLIGQQFPPDQHVGVENLRALLASADFTADEARDLNALLPAGIAALPTDAGQLAHGAQVAAVLRLGDQGRRTLALPLDGSRPEPGEAEPQAQPGATAATSDSAKWFDLQKSFGPLHFERIGFEYREQALRFLLDAALSMAGLTISLDGLSFGSPIDHFAPVFDLRGLGVAYKNGQLEIGGALMRIPASAQQPYDEYDGAVVIRTAKLSLAALGSYANIAGHPSLFVYGVLDYPIGGPSFFFVTGLAAGFGYNRRVVVPPIEQVGSFPLVTAAQPTASSSTGAQSPRDLLKTTLHGLRESLPPADGEIFLAAGLRFTSFKIVDSFALLLVTIGSSFRVDVLGLSNMVAPPDAGPSVTPVAEVQLALKASFVPDEGFLGVSAQLTKQSYLFDRACQLTGGFAFYAWFAGPHSGDFVLTVGGYHTAFQPPAHYPRVPRVGFNWNYSDALTIRGAAYFALTPAALMAGANLEVNWHSGDLHAWFKAGVDFLIAWKPYHYDAHVFVDVGAEYTFWFFGTRHLSVHVGADLHIWGPEFAGTAQIHLSIISFDVAFGAQSRPAAQLIEWADFKRAFLPAQVCSLALQGGLLKKRSEALQDLGLIDAQQLVLSANTLVPFTAATIGGRPVQSLATLYATSSAGQLAPLASEASSYAPAQPLGARSLTVGMPSVGPVGVQAQGQPGVQLLSSYAITITRGGQPAEHDFVFTPIAKHAPSAMWGPLDPQLKPRLDGNALVENTLAGFLIHPAQPQAGEHTASLPLARLGHPAGMAGALQFSQFHMPPLEAGVYEVEVNHTVASANDPAGQLKRIPQETFTTKAQFTVAAARLALAPADVQALFPPEGSLGDYTNVLPHIVLSASTLPWLRPGAPGPKGVPWLALLLFDEGEAPAVRVASLAALGNPAQLPAEFPPAGFPAGALASGEHPDDKLSVIDLPQALLRALLPAPADLALLAHTRQALDATGQPAGPPVAVVIANRLPQPGKRSTAHLVVVSGLFPNGALDPGPLPGSGLVRLISLKSWSFASTTSEQNLQGLLNRLNRSRGVLGEAAPLPRALADGTRITARYHGPCVPAAAPPASALPVHAARELIVAEHERPNLSYAAAWELGRLLVLQNGGVALDLYHWKRARAQRRKGMAVPAHLPLASKPSAGIDLPPAALSWCADLMLLKGLPFNYLVPDEALLPAESLRFFSIDRAWLDCLLDGAFSVGRVTTLARAHEAELFGELRAAVWARLGQLAAQASAPLQPVPLGVEEDRPDTTSPATRPEPVLSGVLLRSDAVAGWPGLLAQAHDAGGTPLTELRREQLSPNVLLWVFAGEVGEIGLYQKPETLHFGLDKPDDLHAALHKENTRDDGADATVPVVPWDAATRAVQVGKLAEQIGSRVGEARLTSAQFARWMIEQTPHVSIAR